MYNLVTENIIQQSPEIAGISQDELPQYLTKVFAKIVSVRRKLSSAALRNSMMNDIPELRKLANNLETLTVLNRRPDKQLSAAFVAATAHHLLYLISKPVDDNFQRDSIPSIISSIILFLIGDSPADAAEVAGKLEIREENTIKDQLFNSVCYLAKGQIGSIRSIEPITKEYLDSDADNEAEDHLWYRLLLGLQQIAKTLLGLGNAEIDYFKEVENLAKFDELFFEETMQNCYSGPHHFSQLLGILQDRLLKKGVINVPPPEHVEAVDWSDFLKKLAIERPYLWENHFDVVQTGFLNLGNSAVLAFPTGAGKTTVSELKIASTMMGGSSVLYLVPTHALEDQVRRDLKRLFDNMNADQIEIGGEYTELGAEQLSTINVMTPERCLTLLSMAPEKFESIGLVVFDEFHLISGKDDKIDRRGLDAMFCLLQLFTEIPTADFLLISAMVENSEEVAEWVSKITERRCSAFNSNWKPTRQLQGCVVYPEKQINFLKEAIRASRSSRPPGSNPNTELKNLLRANPHQLFSLSNIWDPERPGDFFIRKLFSENIALSISQFTWQLTSNRNVVAAHMAAFFIKQGIKTLVFVDNPTVAKSTSKKLMEILDSRSMELDQFANTNARRIEALTSELGDLGYSHFSLENQVAVHHGLLLPAERQLNEALFKRPDGIHGMIATATLAQGINLPAEVVIIAGDDRFDEDTDARESLLAHEILNTAGRAGRAGSSAQGVVIIVPGKVISFKDKETAPGDWVELQTKIFSKSDQCLTVNDPLTLFLDEIVSDRASSELTMDTYNLLLRLHTDENSNADVSQVFNKSLTAFRANKANESENFQRKIERLISRREGLALDLLYEDWVETVSLKTGINPELINNLGTSLGEKGTQELNSYNIADWINWFLSWLNNDVNRIDGFFPSIAARTQLARAIGLRVSNFRISEVAEKIMSLKPLMVAYVEGRTYKEISDLIPGNADPKLTKARHFILRLMPHFSFAMGAITMTLREKYNKDDISDLSITIRQLATMIREGLDTEEKVQFKLSHGSYLRTQCHDKFSLF